jgi:hypothetical protein
MVASSSSQEDGGMAPSARAKTRGGSDQRRGWAGRRGTTVPCDQGIVVPMGGDLVIASAGTQGSSVQSAGSIGRS